MNKVLILSVTILLLSGCSVGQNKKKEINSKEVAHAKKELDNKFKELAGYGKNNSIQKKVSLKK